MAGNSKGLDLARKAEVHVGKLKIISFTAAAMVLGLERRVVLGDAYAGPNGEPKQDLTIEGLNADDARAILAALDQPDVPAAAPVKEIAKAAPKPTPAPESPKRSEPALTAAPPETRRRRAAAPVPPTPPPPEEEEEEEEEEDKRTPNGVLSASAKKPKHRKPPKAQRQLSAALAVPIPPELDSPRFRESWSEWLRYRALELGKSVGWINGIEWYSRQRDRIAADRSESEEIARLITPDVLIVSDPLPPDASLTSYQAAMLYQVIDRRYRNMKATWATINVVDQKDLARRMTGPIADRILDNATVVQCWWPSHRRAFRSPSKEAAS